MEGSLDPFDFALAEALGRTVEEMNATLSNVEYVQWRAFYVYRAAMRELARKEARKR